MTKEAAQASPRDVLQRCLSDCRLQALTPLGHQCAVCGQHEKKRSLSRHSIACSEGNFDGTFILACTYVVPAGFCRKIDFMLRVMKPEVQDLVCFE